jgi:BA14K-like protein
VESAQSIHFRVQFESNNFVRAIAARLGNVRALGRLQGLLPMEPTMISLKVMSTAAAIALVLPIVAPSASFAQHPNGGKAGFAARGGGGAPMARVGGGGGGASMARFSGVSAGAAPAARFGGASGGAAMTRYSGGYGGGWRGGEHRGYRHGGGFFPGAVAGAVVGGALASSYAYYGGPDYYDAGYYDNPYDAGYYDNAYYDDDAAVVAAIPAPVGDDSVGYCMQTYRSYDPASGTYLCYDGLRHPCP